MNMMKTLTEKQKKLLYRILAAIVLMILLSILPLKQYPAVRFLLFLVPYFTVGFDILRKAFKGIRNRQVFDENFLMAVATIGAMVLGEYTEGVAVMLFYQIGELFQSIAVGKSRRNISELMDIRPDYANLVTEDGVEKVDPDDVETGSILLIQPGERVPIDGVVVEGSSSLDTSALTGESLPRDISEGDEILSGSINQSGVLRMRTTREFEESTASRILDLVENAGSRKAKSEQFITRFARWYTPAVCYSALALAVLAPVVSMVFLHRSGGWALWSKWIYRALTFLVISCPCAIVVSIPLTFFGGIGGAGSKGILIKGANFMETLADVRTVVFDKTGTLTKGNFAVARVCPAHTGYKHKGYAHTEDTGDTEDTEDTGDTGDTTGDTGDTGNTGEEPGRGSGGLPAKESRDQASAVRAGDKAGEERLLEYAALAESFSTHPISRSLREACRVNGKEPESQGRVGACREISGRGVVTEVDGKSVAAGNSLLMQELGIVIPPEDDHSKTETGTIVHVAADGQYLGHILIADEVKPHAADAIRELGRAGVTRTVMLTGDAGEIAAHVAGDLGIDEYHARLLPEQKVEKVEALLAEKAKGSGRGSLAFVGDGINDAPVLSRADIGIAMGALGSDAAIEAADVVLMDDDPLRIAEAVRIARKCIRIVHENIGFAIGVKAICLLLGAVGIANMWLAIFADVGVMVLCVLNAIRALV